MSEPIDRARECLARELYEAFVAEDDDKDAFDWADLPEVERRAWLKEAHAHQAAIRAMLAFADTPRPLATGGLPKQGPKICRHSQKPTSECTAHNLHCSYPNCVVQPAAAPTREDVMEENGFGRDCPACEGTGTLLAQSPATGDDFAMIGVNEEGKAVSTSVDDYAAAMVSLASDPLFADDAAAGDDRTLAKGREGEEEEPQLNSAVAKCDWPAGGSFTFMDDPGAHDPCYVVMPGGAALPLNHHAGEGVDIARAKFIIAACNEALANASTFPNSMERENPCAAIFDHKWLDTNCVFNGCQSLVLGHALSAYLKAQRRMLERWSEGDDAVRAELWKALHECEEGAIRALQPDHIGAVSVQTVDEPNKE